MRAGSLAGLGSLRMRRPTLWSTRPPSAPSGSSAESTTSWRGNQQILKVRRIFSFSPLMYPKDASENETWVSVSTQTATADLVNQQILKLVWLAAPPHAYKSGCLPSHGGLGR